MPSAPPREESDLAEQRSSGRDLTCGFLALCWIRAKYSAASLGIDSSSEAVDIGFYKESLGRDLTCGLLALSWGAHAVLCKKLGTE